MTTIQAVASRPRLKSRRRPSLAGRRALSYLRLPPIPRFLDRSKWTKAEWKRHEEACREYMTEMRRKTDDEIFRKSRRYRQLKELREKRRLQNQLLREQRKARRLKKDEDRLRVYASIEHGRETVGQIVKALKLDKKIVSSALRYWIRKERIVKVSARRYATVNGATERKRPRLPQQRRRSKLA